MMSLYVLCKSSMPTTIVGTGMIAAFHACSNLFIAQIVTAMTMAKYQDKTVRKTR